MGIGEQDKRGFYERQSQDVHPKGNLIFADAGNIASIRAGLGSARRPDCASKFSIVSVSAAVQPERSDGGSDSGEQQRNFVYQPQTALLCHTKRRTGQRG